MSTPSPSLLATHANCLPVGTRVADFEIIGLIGEGGFGIVYLARDTSLDRIVALKEFMPGAFAGRVDGVRVAVRAANQKATFDAGLRSFINEAKMLAQFSHPALLEVYRFWEENGTAYMAMRFYKGETLRQVLSEGNKQFDENAVAQTIGPIFDALEMLHREQVFHRDIAPDNIMLADGRPVLLDFGSARRIVSDGTQALTTVLKPGYAPIEQYSDDGTMKQGAWTDVYALGGVLYHLATGKAPLQAVSRMLSDPLQTVNQVTGEKFSQRFSDAVSKAMSVHVTNRFQTVTEFREALGWNIGALPRVITVQHAQVWLDPDAANRDGEPHLKPVVGKTETAASLPSGEPPERHMTPPIAAGKSAKSGRLWFFGLGAVVLISLVAAGLTLRAPARTATSDSPVVSAQASDSQPTKQDPKPPIASQTQVVPSTEPTMPIAEGVVKFDIKPRGRIDVNGFARAVSPPTTELKLPIGKHTIDIVFSQSVSVTRTIDVTSDAPVTITHTFK